MTLVLIVHSIDPSKPSNGGKSPHEHLKDVIQSTTDNPNYVHDRVNSRPDISSFLFYYWLTDRHTIMVRLCFQEQLIERYNCLLNRFQDAIGRHRDD